MVIPDESYSDQPFIVKTNDGAWLCVMTTGAGHEGQSGQHIVTLRSLDQGQTWIDQRDVETCRRGRIVLCRPAESPPLVEYLFFYNHNTDNIRELKADDDKNNTKG